MENRKPAGRPVRRYERSDASSKRSRAVGRPDTRPGKSVLMDNNKEVELIRLNRFIANSGVCSRRDADEHIENGLISVNGKIVTDLGTKVTYNDEVRFKNKRLSAESLLFLNRTSSL